MGWRGGGGGAGRGGAGCQPPLSANGIERCVQREGSGCRSAWLRLLSSHGLRPPLHAAARSSCPGDRAARPTPSACMRACRAGGWMAALACIVCRMRDAACLPACMQARAAHLVALADQALRQLVDVVFDAAEVRVEEVCTEYDVFGLVSGKPDPAHASGSGLVWGQGARTYR